jgi:flagella synthesis protein FlgN
MMEPTLIRPLFEKQQEHLWVLLALLKSELAAIASRNVEELDKCCEAKLQCLEDIQQLDTQIAAIPNLTELKTQPWFVENLQAIDDVLQQCKEQNEINSLTLQQSQLIVERFKHELLQNRGKSGLTYTAKGKPAIDNKGSGIKA